jgi:alkanesulfonate monooxygenase SsuD/methylene tetrahydromethanopterin reductase-like flavin-dependent oxidoreductase (luciferase family)
VRVGVIVPQGWREDLPGRDFETMVGVARRAEELGYDSIWLYDHLQTRAGDPNVLFECWTSLAALARETSRVRLGQIVTCALYRNAGLLAQMATTVDAASKGRLLIGVGAGWDEREYLEFGYDAEFPAIGERLANLERTLEVLRARGSCPILVGGAGERVLLRLVARFADACNFTDSFDPAFYRHKLDVLRRHCEAVDRDYDTIEKTASFTVTADLDPAVLRAIASVGIETFILYVDPPTDLAALERLASTLL